MKDKLLPHVDHTRQGDWIQTYTGRSFWPFDPRADEISSEDIAHSLSMKCRFGGHTRIFYSVAEHSVLVSRLVSPENARWGLLHDAAEAYSADIPRPVRRGLPEWKQIEYRIMHAVCERFGLAMPEPREVTEIDTMLLYDERLVLMRKCARDWGIAETPMGAPIVGYSPEIAKELFLDRFYELWPWG